MVNRDSAWCCGCPHSGGAAKCIVCVKGLTVLRAGIAALKGVTCHIKEGEIVAVLGANGSGKSTLLLTIAGELMPAEGSVDIMGGDVGQQQSWERCRGPVAMVPQLHYLYEGLTIEENIEVAAVHSDLRDRASRIGKAKSMWGLSFPTINVDERVSRLSTGEARFLSIVCGLVRRKPLLLLDEPSAGLSDELASIAFRSLKQMLAIGAGVLLVEQRYEMALSVADRVLFLDEGCVAWSGTNHEFRMVQRGG